MKPKQVLLLTLLAAIWGGSFMLMRILSPAIGAIGTSFSRLFIAGLFFVAYYKIAGVSVDLKRDWKILAIVGVINSAVPFSLFAFAALYVPVSLSSIINSMSPMFGLIFAVLFLGDRMNLRQVGGIILGVVGVAVISGSRALPATTLGYMSVLACLGGAICYGLGSAIVKKYTAHIEPVVLAGLSQLFAGISLLPFVAAQKIDYHIDAKVIIAALLLSLICSGLAYMIYYSLIRSVGATKALTVTFLIPVFSMFWALLILGEAIYSTMIYGMLIVLLGTFLVLYQPANKYDELKK